MFLLKNTLSGRLCKEEFCGCQDVCKVGVIAVSSAAAVWIADRRASSRVRAPRFHEERLIGSGESKTKRLWVGRPESLRIRDIFNSSAELPRISEGEFLQALMLPHKSGKFRKKFRGERRAGRPKQVLVLKFVDTENRAWLYYLDIPLVV